jgi:hypothetical protein
MKVPPSICPTCQYLNDAATYLQDETVQPKPDDFSVCLNCGEILIFNADLTTRSVTLNDLVDLPPEIHAELTRMQRAVRRLPEQPQK